MIKIMIKNIGQFLGTWHPAEQMLHELDCLNGTLNQCNIYPSHLDILTRKNGMAIHSGRAFYIATG